MSYSVENLRIIANAMATDPAYKPDDVGIEVSYIREAADEIERLRKALFEIGDYNRFGWWTLQAELARTALEGK